MKKTYIEVSVEIVAMMEEDVIRTSELFNRDPNELPLM